MTDLRCRSCGRVLTERDLDWERCAMCEIRRRAWWKRAADWIIMLPLVVWDRISRR